jgi:hypothetical protein
MLFAWNTEKIMILIFFLLSFVPSVFAASTTKVQAIGYSAIIAGDQAGAFEQAKRAALREAVEEGIGVLLSSQALVENLVVLEDHILTSTSGYVRSFNIIDRGLLDATTYRVKIDATVELGALQRSIEALDLLIESAGNPYIIILNPPLSTENGGRESLTIDTILRASFEETSAQFNFMAPPIVYTGNTIEDAALFGLENGADIVIRGFVRQSQATPKTIPFSNLSLEAIGLQTAIVELSLDALWTDTGEVFSSHVRNERAAASSIEEAGHKALVRAGETLTDSLVQNLVENWRQKVYSGRLVRLVIQMPAEELPRFEGALTLVLGGIEKMYRRSYTDGIAVYDIRSKDSGFELARQLTTNALKYFDIVIEQVTPNSLKLQIANKI